MRKIHPVLLAGILLLSACSPHFHLDFLGKDEIQETVIIPSPSKDKVLLLDISGTIQNAVNPGLWNKEGDLLSQVRLRLRKAEEDPHIKGIILRLNTPGGEVTASDILYHEIQNFRRKTGVPVTALMMGVAASGGYYIASACDTLIAHPSTVTGSIGVISLFPCIKGLMNKVGVKVNIVKSGEMKDAGSPFRQMSEKERNVFQSIINDFYRKFVDVVYQARKSHLTRSELEQIADGRIYTASQALELGLIDEIGYFGLAFQQIKNRAGIPNARVVAYTYYPDRKTNIYALSSANQEWTLLQDWENYIPSLKAGFYYLWLPQSD